MTRPLAAFPKKDRKEGETMFHKNKDYLEKHPETYRLPETFPGIRQELSVARKYRNWPIMAYFDLIRINTEKPFSFYHFKSFIHHS